MKSYNSLSSLFKDIGLSIAKKHKAYNLSSISPMEFAEKIDSIDIIDDEDQIPLGEVKDIRFSIVGGVLNIMWNDPFDVTQNGSVLSHFGMTKLIAKLGSYPQNPEDGILIYSGTTRDKHSYTPYSCDLNSLGLIQDNQEIYFKFFSATSGNYWNTNFLINGANEFTSSSYDWTMIYSALKDYPNSRQLLPDAGSTVYVDYIVRDYYVENKKNIACETRNEVVENIDKLSAVATPWRILGYNANVPQYVGYRRYDESIGQWQYIYVQSVDDSLSTVNCYNSNGTTEQKTIFVGNKQFRQITFGCRTYTEDAWDYQICKKKYTDTGFLIESVTNETFGYDNEGTGTQNVYYVPFKITVNSKEYDFCGYTMTIQPQHCLISINRTSDTATSEYNTIQFDAAEIKYNHQLINSFPDEYDINKKYFTIKDDGLHEIDWSTSALVDINSLSDDVYLLEDNELKLQTTYFEKYHNYQLYQNTDGVETYEQIPEILDFELNTPYYNACVAKSYMDSVDPKQLSVYADVVRYNNQLYVCKTNITAEKNNKTPDQLTAYFRTLTSDVELKVKSLYEQGKYFVPGQKITTTIANIKVVEKNQTNTAYGRNTYEESFYKQYCNNINGSRRSGDIEYKTQHKFDVVSTSGLANANSLMLKLHKEQQLIQHICPAVNRTVLSNPCGPYRKEHLKNNRQTWETSIDTFWPLALYEVFGSGVDASSTFSVVYSDNASRIKMRMLADGTASTTAVHWWLRNPNTGYSHFEYHVYPSGAQNSHISYYSNGFSPACIIT